MSSSAENTTSSTSAGAAQLRFDSEHRLRSENLAFDIDVWYPLVAHLTARSLFLPLTLAEARAILAFHDVSWRQSRERLTQREVRVLRGLEREIDALLRDSFLVDSNGDSAGSSSAGSAFVRLCGRSPKDGDPLDFARVRREYESAVRDILKDSDNDSNSNSNNNDNDNNIVTAAAAGDKAEEAVNIFQIDPLVKLQAMARVSTMKVRSGAEVLSLLLTSERVYADMLDWTRYGEPEQVVLREWCEEMRLDYEFRLYVHRGRVTAISQYDHYAYYAHLEREKDFLQEGLLQYWRTVHAALTKTTMKENEKEEESETHSRESEREHTISYVVDIAYLPRSQSFVLVELSPFAPCTGAALFSWSADKDVLEGKAPMEFRIKRREDLHPQLNDLLQWNWEDRWFNPHREPMPYYEYFAGLEEEEENKKQGLFKNLTNWFSSSSSRVKTREEDENKDIDEEKSVDHLLFVYGTLKRGFHWNGKYLSPRLGARFLCTASSLSPFPLVIGDCGVPYLLGDMPDQGMRIEGELWAVSASALKGLDEYEGVGKGYYARRSIDVQKQGTNGSATLESDIVKADVYILTQSTEDLRGRPFLSEYPLSAPYQPIEHIQVKQLAYVGALSSWGKTQEIIATENVTH